MKPINPIESLRQVGGGNPQVEEQAQVHSSAYGIASAPDPATGLPVKDATFNNGGGYSASINPGGPGDTTDFPQDVAALSATRSSVDPNARDFGHELTPNEPDGWEDRGSGVDNIIRNGR
jgi:hypothetical protein